jgi:glycogen debranching enzyme
VPVKTIAGFWPLIAGIPTKTQALALADELQDTNAFNRTHRVPTLAADQQGYDPAGGYWCGAVWAPTDTMVIRGLERYGYRTLARDIAMNHLDCIGAVFKRTGTVWENYAPDSTAPGKPAKGDFVGWTGIGPIAFLLEYAIGLAPDAHANTLTWNLNSAEPSGCERYRFNGHIADLIATPEPTQWNIRVHSDGPFTLKVIIGKQNELFVVKKGENHFVIKQR